MKARRRGRRRSWFTRVPAAAPGCNMGRHCWRNGQSVGLLTRGSWNRIPAESSGGATLGRVCRGVAGKLGTGGPRNRCGGSASTPMVGVACRAVPKGGGSRGCHAAAMALSVRRPGSGGLDEGCAPRPAAEPRQENAMLRHGDHVSVLRAGPSSSTDEALAEQPQQKATDVAMFGAGWLIFAGANLLSLRRVGLYNRGRHAMR